MLATQRERSLLAVRMPRHVLLILVSFSAGSLASLACGGDDTTATAADTGQAPPDDGAATDGANDAAADDSGDAAVNDNGETPDDADNDAPDMADLLDGAEATSEVDDGDTTSDAESGPSQAHFRPARAGVVERAAALRAALPHTTVRVGGRTGTVLTIVATMPPDPVDPTRDSGVLEPLAPTLGSGRAAMATAMHGFFRRFAPVWALESDGSATLRHSFDPEHPEVNLRLALDAQNPELEGFTRATTEDGLRAVRLVQVVAGARIAGRHTIGWFDATGNLLGVETRLFPLPAVTMPGGTLDVSGARAALGAHASQIAAGDRALAWLPAALGDDAALEQAAELLWIPDDENDPESPLHLTWELWVRRNLDVARVRLDAVSGAVRAAWSESASDDPAWYTDGTIDVVPAPDETGTIFQIPSTVFDGRRFMGMGTAWDAGAAVDDPPLAYGSLFQVSDSQARPELDPGAIYVTVIESPAQTSVGDLNTWQTEADYAGGMRAATGVVRNVAAAFAWWGAAPRNWQGWDGRGSTLWTAVNLNPSDPDPITGVRAPVFNAWGADGYLSIGDGQDSLGRTMATSREIIGHEFMHNVISATSRLAYHDEPGAVNEALADFYGVALTVADDDFADDFVGNDDNDFARNVVNPAMRGRPDRYSLYLGTTDDAGGVHTNSGILSKALALLVRDAQPDFGGVAVARQGFAKTEEIVRAATFMRAYDPESTMEEVAAAMVGTCDLVDLVKRLTLGPDHPVVTSGVYADLCRSFRAAFRATELLPGSYEADLVVEGVGYHYTNQSDRYAALEVRITNDGIVGDLDLTSFEMQLTDELGEVTVLPIDASLVHTVGGVIVGAQLLPGVHASIRVDIDEATLQPLGSATRRMVRALRMAVVPLATRPLADVDLSNNRVDFAPGPDLQAPFVEWHAESFETSLYDRYGFGLPGGMHVTAFERTSAHGPLEVLASPEADQVLAADQPTSTRLPRVTLGEARPATIALASAVPYSTGVPGVAVSWAVDFDAAGGLAVLEGQRQIYLLVDSNDQMTEHDERNNLVCANCFGAVGGASRSGAIVRLSALTDIDALFPAAYRAAARKLVPPPVVEIPSEPAIGHPIGRLPFRGRRPRAAPVVAPLPPVIDDFTPNGGPAGSEVQIWGMNLGALTSVTLEGTPLPIVFASANELRVTIPAEAMSGFFRVENEAGADTAVWPFAITPAITLVAPTDVICNHRVTVTGNHFFDIFDVRIGGAAVSSFSTVSYTAIEVTPGCTVPLAAGLITVINAGGTATSLESVTVLPKP